jgi:hypothetical protein
MFDFFKKKSPAGPPAGPDFSGVDSPEKAVALFQQGQLEKLFLMPLEFGGQDNALNVLYVPIGVHDVKNGIDCNVIAPLVEAGKVSQYRCEPEYQGNSVIPIAVKITASEPGSFTTTINIWGEALGRDD